MESFKNCGWASFLMLFMGLMGLTACVLALVLTLMRRPVGGMISAGASLVLALMSFGTGPLGAMYGRQVTDSVVDSNAIDPSRREQIRQMGYQEADACIPVGLSLGATPLVAGVIALAVALRAKKRLAEDAAAA
ncbi:MAG TPA: hypothetical protein VK459_05260 [Polyangiaceae bacterium]|nr:hypothetical protein [Polyangiaceae bacterium]